MAFAIRRMFSNITYFKKTENPSNNDTPDVDPPSRASNEEPIMINYDHAEPDSTSRHSRSLKLPESLKNYAAKKGSLSDTDILNINVEFKPREKRKKCKKLKVDIKKASHSMDRLNNQENTPKHILLECKSSEIFTEKFKGFDFDKSFDLYESTSEEHISLFDDELGSFSEQSDSEMSVPSKLPVKMCRKVEITDSKSNLDLSQLVPSVTPESFGDIVVERSEEEYLKLFQGYMLKFEELESYTKKLLNDFQFYIDVGKAFEKIPELQKKSQNKIPSRLTSKSVSRASSWNVLNANEDDVTRCKLKKKLLSIKNRIDDFVHENLNNKTKSFSNSTHNYSHRQISQKKKIKHYDFPDLRDAMIGLFHTDNESSINETHLDFDESDCPNCHCKCHQYSSSQSDSGLTSKSQDQSITSSIGNFSLDSTTLTAYSESLDQIVSYNSFRDTSLYNTLLQKAAIERITFYVQVHSIQLKCEVSEMDQERNISFHCIPCTCVETNENGLLRHILSQNHCEKIHFIYKTAYIKKCVAAGVEIQPSTILNPMTMYRDDNKIVCFGDALYACSLCFENLIIGESVLMAHCSDPVHVDRRERLSDIIG
ncbi:uncharacterized protein LOC121736551 [Aricia agestis]|uniref:uncharacterized protein LOC121736551 n=1 Tax=Aricia agestis TaxID=91739 RepID=UPI001C209E74|nr:uncharacterized protein LOC121736551 [Aricia agestis]XP_041983764.1 uncharacterized protein LOC121736551 [Aricia agestis]